MQNFSNVILIMISALLIFSAFFSAAEMAYTSCNRIKLKNLAAQGKKRAARALRLIENYDTLISTVLIGNNVVNIALSSLATLLLVSIAGSNAGVSLATFLTSVTVLIAGEITPKTLARESPETCAMIFAPILQCFIVLFMPLNFLTMLWKKFIITSLKIKSNRSITEEELLTFVEEARQDGGINEREEVMIKRTIDFDDKTAGDICTPRVDLCAVSVLDSAQMVRQKFRETGFSRLPVFKDSIDNITGLIILKDFHYEVIDGGRELKDIIKPAVYIPSSVKAARVLKILQEKKTHLAVIIDEFGGTMGIVTIEDILEEIVGEIWDEHDTIIENIRKIDDRYFAVQGKTSLNQLRDYFSLEINDCNDAALASWILEKSGGEIHDKDIFDFYGMKITISKIRHNRVIEVLIEK
ncbi:MAG: hemolysin family protein [Spirochaetaceae bacterium]|jgi:CBS domain containing-hemolysin-like protein|nr:hemolysin family protein [Spirochaetaceae bacterium]